MRSSLDRASLARADAESGSASSSSGNGPLDRQRRVEAQFERQLGTDFYRARDFAAWVAAHPRRSEIMAFVQSRIR
jgi:hypothetical protein